MTTLDEILAHAVMMTATGIYETEALAREAVADYADNPDYVIEIAPVTSGPKAGGWWGKAHHKDWDLDL